MKRSHGYHSKHSRRVKTIPKGITKLLQSFEVGDTVRINNDARKNGAMPLRFNGRTAKITAKQGKGYVVSFRDLRATKVLVLNVAHLEKI